MKKKICVIFTGGTIGSDSNGKTLSLSGGSRKMLLEKYREVAGDQIAFDEFSPINILSENVQPEDLEKVYECIKGLDISPYDGIIITHGTDTLCFTVNCFSRVFCAFPLPIVLVSALYPLTDKRSNGVKNFSGAVDFIEKGGVRGVYCAFTNGAEDCKIHLGSRLTYPDELNGYYHSALNAHFAQIHGGEVIFNDSPYLPTREQINSNPAKNCDPSLDTKVMLITMRSLLNFAAYDFTETKPKAVIVELSHSGTVCTRGTDLNFKKFAVYCKQCGVQVVIAPIMSRAGVYESMSKVPENVMICYDTTLEMTVVKVMAAIGAGLSANAYFDENCAFEKIYYPD